MSGVDVSAIVVNHNGGDLLVRCLAALATAAGTCTLETVVVDNGSTDGSPDSLPDALRPAVLIRVGRNLGYGTAARLGADRARGRHWLLLNTDCFLEPGALEALISRLEADPAAAVVGPLLLEVDGSLQRSCHDFPSPAVFLIEQSSLWRLIARRPGVQWPALATSHDRPRSVDWVTGACWLVRPAAWRAVGGFDPAFFFYFEETELCYRLRQHGWRIWFDPAARAVHVGGGSSDTTALLGEYFRGLHRFYLKHYPRPARAAVRLMVVCMAAFKAARAGKSAFVERDENRRRRARAEVRAWVDVMTMRAGAPDIRRLRRPTGAARPEGRA